MLKVVKIDKLVNKKNKNKIKMRQSLVCLDFIQG